MKKEISPFFRHLWQGLKRDPYGRRGRRLLLSVGRHERMQRPARSFLGHSGIWLSKTQGEEGGTGKGASIQRISEGNGAVLH